MMARLLLALPLLLWGSSCTPPQPAPEDPFVFDEKPIPTRAEWLERLVQHPDEEPDLIEAATVIACDRLRIRRPYSSIPRVLAPHVQDARTMLKPSATEKSKIAVLNSVVLPAIHDGLKEEFGWLRQTLQSPPKEVQSRPGNCFVSALLYMIAADMLSLRLEMFPLPRHVALCRGSGDGRRNIECTDKGEHWSIDYYRRWSLKIHPDHVESVPEDKTAAEAYCSPMTRRQLTAMMLCQAVGTLDQKEEETFKAASRIAPDFYYPWKILSGFYSYKCRYSEAEAAATKAIELAPHLPGLYAARSMCRMLLEKLNPALEDIDAALALSPRNAKYHQCKGAILFRLERFRQASECFSRAAEEAPHCAEFWRYRGLGHETLKEYRQAADALTRAIELDPRNALYYDRRAKVWAMLGDEVRWEADRRKVTELGGLRE